MAGLAFVTGGSGFLGGALVEALVEAERPVRALVRSDDAARALAARGVEPVRGDVLEPEGLRAGMTGCDTVFHAAGVNLFCLSDSGTMFRVNVEGSANVVRAAADAGVRRVVYTSSAATLGEYPGAVGDERTTHRGWYLSDYERSKHQAELRVREEARRLRVDVVSVNPSSVQGPGRTEGTARMLVAYANGRLRTLVDTRVSFVDVADCTAGHLLAEVRGVPDDRYVLNGATLRARDLIALVGSLTGMQRRVVFLPGWVAVGGAAAVEAVFRVRGRRAPVCREIVRTLLHGHAYDGSRAERELGLRYTPVEESIRRTLAWYAEHGYLRRGASGITR